MQPTKEIDWKTVFKMVQFLADIAFDNEEVASQDKKEKTAHKSLKMYDMCWLWWSTKLPIKHDTSCFSWQLYLRSNHSSSMKYLLSSFHMQICSVESQRCPINLQLLLADYHCLPFSTKKKQSKWWSGGIYILWQRHFNIHLHDNWHRKLNAFGSLSRS